MTKKLLAVSAALSTLSALLYAFTGVHFWSPTMGNASREALLLFAHGVPIIFYLMSKIDG